MHDPLLDHVTALDPALLDLGLQLRTAASVVAGRDTALAAALVDRLVGREVVCTAGLVAAMARARSEAA